MIIHDHWSCWSCMKFVDHAMIRYWSCMISVDHAMKGCWSCMKSVDHAMKGCWSYMMINDHCHERLLIIHDQHWSVYHIVTTKTKVIFLCFCRSQHHGLCILLRFWMTGILSVSGHLLSLLRYHSLILSEITASFIIAGVVSFLQKQAQIRQQLLYQVNGENHEKWIYVIILL